MMGSVCYQVLVCVLVGALVWGSGWCEDTSNCKDPCKCNDVNIKGVAEKIKLKNITVTISEYIYLLSMCDPIGCTFDQSNKSVNHTAAACQYIENQNRWGMLGQVKEVTWNITNKTNFWVAYAGGDKSDKGKEKRTKVIFGVGGAAKGLDYNFVAEDENSSATFHDYIFAVTVDSLSQPAGAPVGYAGLVILLLLAIGIGAYFIIGAAVMYKVKGARGVEVIPNYLFWKSVPILIKDGVKFTFSPCIKKFNGGYEAL